MKTTDKQQRNTLPMSYEGFIVLLFWVFFGKKLTDRGLNISNNIRTKNTQAQFNQYLQRASHTKRKYFQYCNIAVQYEKCLSGHKCHVLSTLIYKNVDLRQLPKSNYS